MSIPRARWGLGLLFGALAAPASALVLSQGDLLVLDAGRAAPAVPARVVRVRPDTGAQQVVSEGGHLVEPLAIAQTSDGDVLVADAGGEEGAKLVRIEPSTGAQALIPGVEPVGLAVDPADGTVYVTDGVGATVREVDLATGSTTPVGGGAPIDFAQSLAVGAGSQLYVADFDTAWNVVRLNPTTGGKDPLAPALGFVGGLTAAANSLWITQPDSDAVVRMDLGTLEVEPVSSGGELLFPFAIAAEGDGSLVVADWGSSEVEAAVLRVDPASGAQSIVASGDLLVEPWGIAVVAVPEGGATLGAIAALSALALRQRAGARSRRAPRARSLHS